MKQEYVQTDDGTVGRLIYTALDGDQLIAVKMEDRVDSPFMAAIKEEFGDWRGREVFIWTKSKKLADVKSTLDRIAEETND